MGRLSPLIPSVARLTRFPKGILVASLLRGVWVPLYVMCNKTGGGGGGVGNGGDGVGGAGGGDKNGGERGDGGSGSDAFYLIVVQMGFGITNGLLGSLCMMGAGEYAEEEEKEAAGGFMGMMLVGGLSVGSLVSFAVA